MTTDREKVIALLAEPKSPVDVGLGFPVPTVVLSTYVLNAVPAIVALIEQGRREGCQQGIEAAATIVDNLDHDLQDDTEGFRSAAFAAIAALDPDAVVRSSASATPAGLQDGPPAAERGRAGERQETEP